MVNTPWSSALNEVGKDGTPFIAYKGYVFHSERKWYRAFVAFSI